MCFTEIIVRGDSLEQLVLQNTFPEVFNFFKDF